jgi:hypothetical protein
MGQVRDSERASGSDSDPPLDAGSRRRRGAPGEGPAADLSEWIRRVRRMPIVREDLIRKVRAEIAAGKYETPQKLDIAVRRLLEDLLGE